MYKHFQLLAFALCTLLVLPAAAQVPSYVPTDGLVGWWPFNGNANDESGNGNDGAVNGATLTEDRFGNGNNAYNFNGSNFIDCGTSTSMVMTNSVTLSCWGKTTNQFPNHCIAGRWSNVSFDPAPYGTPEYCLVFDNTRVTSAIVISTPPNEYVSAPISYYDNEWHLYTMTYDGATNKIFIDGNLASQAAFSGSIQSFVNKFVIGTYGLGGYPELPNSWIGDIDDVALYNRALTEQEIQNLYTGTTPPPCVSLPSNLQQGLVGYWPFCGNANDESGNGNDGVVNGATLTEDRFGNAGKAYAFDGLGSYIQTPAVQSSIYQYSVSAWFKSIEGGTMITGKKNITGPSWVTTDTIGITLDLIHEPGNLEFGKIRYLADGMAYQSGTTTEQIVNDNNWHHVVSIWNGPTDGGPVNSADFSIYIDGQLSTQNPIELNSANSPLNGYMGVIFGKHTNWDDWSNYLGSLDDIGIWNRALTPEEVQELYTLDACTFTVYDTLTVYETVYDTVYTYETIYDTVTTYVTVTDTLLIDITFVGFEGQPSWLNTVTVFPNPASDHITIDYGNFALMAGYTTIITDAAGATVYSSAVNSQQVEIDINAWAATGVYYMSVYDASGQLVAVRHIVLE